MNDAPRCLPGKHSGRRGFASGALSVTNPRSLRFKSLTLQPRKANFGVTSRRRLRITSVNGRKRVLNDESPRRPNKERKVNQMGNQNNVFTATLVALGSLDFQTCRIADSPNRPGAKRRSRWVWKPVLPQAGGAMLLITKAYH